MSRTRKKRIAISTGGGDAPGLNAVIRAVCRASYRRGWEVLGIEDGFAGLFDLSKTRMLRERDIADIVSRGGTILGTTNRGNPFEWPVVQDGKTVPVDRSDEAVRNWRKLGCDALVAVGGDGTLKIAWQLSKKRNGIPFVGVPKTIDNDLLATDITFGFDTAVNTARDCIDKLHSTAQSHDRIMIVEVMGRHAGWIALSSGVAGGSDVILIPEIPFSMQIVCDHLKKVCRQRSYAIVTVAEGAVPTGGEESTVGPREVGREVRLGGIAFHLERHLQIGTGVECRSLVLGHLQRGGPPTTFDRILGTRFGAAAVRLIDSGDFGKMVCLRTPQVLAVPVEKAIAKRKTVPPDWDMMVSARDIGICFGD
ncbi:MAG: ATP-dependent 6-phosphofructokinase [Planctomycetes bacterium]|nr:ATP-dependent 6-phosphofructokinase [Planctomycetota bacterium]